MHVYRSKDKEYMDGLMNQVCQLNQNAKADEQDTIKSWEYLKRTIVLEDLFDFLRNSSEYVPDYISNRHILNPEIMFITASENEAELEVMNSIISKLDITDYYRTSYTKSSDLKNYQNIDILNSVIKSEVRMVKPKRVILLGKEIANWIYRGEEGLGFINDGKSSVTTTHSLLSLFNKTLSDDQKNGLKHHIWGEISNQN